MNFHHKPVCILVTGKKGSGKTTYWLRESVAHRARWKFYYDPSREVARKLNLPVCTDQPSLVRAVAECRPVCFDSTIHFPGDRRTGFAWFSRQVMALSMKLRGVKLLSCDEFQSVQRLGEEGLPPALGEITDEGRRQEIDCLFASHSVNRVNHLVRDQLTELVCFKTTGSLALNWMEEAVQDFGCDFDRGAIRDLPMPDSRGSYFIRFRDDGTINTNVRSKPQPPRKGSAVEAR